MKKVLITGAGSGLGKGTAIGLARAGHAVIATTQIWPQVSELRAQVEELGLADRVTVDKLDILDQRDVDSAMRYDFDTLVSNAGTGFGGPLAEIPVELVRETFETNVFSNLNLMQRAIRKFVDAGTRGRLVIVSSMGGMLTAYGLGAYCSSKHAIEGIAATLRDELAQGGTGITVQTINPGAYDTGFNDRLGDSTFHWQDDAVNFTSRSSIEKVFSEIMQRQYDPQDMIDKMVEVIGADKGNYRTVWPLATEELVKQVQQDAWTRQVISE
ncbi:SDR family oxidoreductase [Nocardia sp. NPDC059240]|uniref:SDR family oxidoreductase n=1 Tax=Nocardia sp. NPDC059240 TaxID=3346786 RepID=UPI00369A159C